MDNTKFDTEIRKPNQTEKKDDIPREKVVEDAYTQVNQIAFQQNFKVLIGHFKKDSNYNIQTLS